MISYIHLPVNNRHCVLGTAKPGTLVDDYTGGTVSGFWEVTN